MSLVLFEMDRKSIKSSKKVISVHAAGSLPQEISDISNNLHCHFPKSLTLVELIICTGNEGNKRNLNCFCNLLLLV